MPDRGFVLLLKLHCILSSVHALQREDLFPFGPHRGDLILGEGDDETSQVVKLKRPLMFYDTQFRSLYVGTNGIISTQDFPMETQYVDDGFPTDFPVIAAYLSDIDTSRGRGRIFYRADDSPDILHRAAREIRRGFPRSSFSPSDAFIATWENVAPYEEVTRSSPSSNRFNTFQAVLAFDESNTYAIFLYPEDGLQFFGTRPKESYNVQIELPARVGFSRGETEYIQWKRDEPYYSLTSNEQSVKNLYQMGNSGTRGVWIFHIGGASQFNNVMQAQAGEKPSRENIVTLDSTLNGPVKLHIPEPDYPEVDDYDEEFDEDDDETFDFSPLAPTDPRERVHNIPEQPPYPDAGIIPPHPEGYPEAGVVSSYPEARGLPLYPERYQEAGSSNPQRYSEADTRQSYPARYPNPGETHPERYPNPEATHPERYPNPGATHPERYPNPGATHPERYPNPGATHPERYPNPGATHPERYPNPGATHPERYPNPGATHPERYPNPGATHPERYPNPRATHPERYPNPGATHPERYPNPGATHPERYPNPAATHPERHPNPGATHPERYPNPGATHPERYPNPAATHPERYPNPGAAHPERYPNPGAAHPERYRYPERQPERHPERHPERQSERQSERYPEAEPLPGNPLPAASNRHVVSVEEEEELGTGVFTYSTDARETCERNQGQCSQYAYCADYSSGFCCHCHSGYYGNGRQCLVEGTTQRVNGKVNGKLVVGASRTPVEIRNADLHAYVVVSDGRAYTAISHIPESVGWALQPLSAIGGLFGWLFALQQPGFKNGFSVAGAKFIRNVDITFYPGNERLNIIQVAQGLDTQSYLSVIMEIEGQLPVIPRGASVQIQPYREVYHRSNSVITSKANREYSVLSSDGETQTLRYDLRQNITYHDCEHSLRTFPTTQQLNVARVFVLYDQKEKAVRYAMTNEIGSVEDDLKPEHVNPCYDGSHDCDVSAQCFPGSEQAYICRCAEGYQGDGKVCTDIDECADGGHYRCGSHATCLNLPGLYRCECHHGYQFAEDGRTCVLVDKCAEGRCHPAATCYNIPGSFVCQCNPGYEGDGLQCRPAGRPKTACEQERERVQTQFSPRGSRPYSGNYVPQCDDAGKFRPQQCHQSEGQCWCVDTWGREIDGTRTYPGSNAPQCGLPVTPDHEMTACEHQRERLQAEYSSRGDRPHFTIHIPQCDEHGNFRPVQCHTNRNQCWCVDKWGREVPGTRKPSGMDQPRCGLPAPTERPKTACEMQRESTSTEFGPHGSRPHFGSYVTQCDDEGNYIPLQCHSSTGQCWCVDDWGREIPGTKSLSGSVPPQCGPLVPTERPKTACEYQRDKVNAEYSPHGARPSVGFYAPECDEEGEFRPLQCHGSIGQCWCVNERGQEIPGSRTFPGTDQPQCGLPERPKTACEDQRDKVNAEYSLYGARPSVGFYAPECDEDGKFRPLQCHGSIGQCWCVNERGQEIPGTRNLPGTDQPRCGLPERPKTACEDQRDRVNAEYSLYGARPSVGFYAPECDEDGKFRPLQCHGSIGQCWCVNERGQEIPGTRSFPGTDQPRCGLPEPTTRPQTLCERWRQMSETSGTSADQYVPQCDEYGNFSPMQCRGNRVCWCVDKDGREIQGTGTQTGILPACIPTVAPPTVQPTPSSLVTTPSTGTFLLYAQGQHIGYLPLNGTQLNTEGAKSLLALHGSIVIGIDYDCREKMVYWTDVAGRTINRISLEIGAEPEIMINSGLTSPEGLTIDYLRRLMFWTDSGSDKIEVAKVDGTHRRVLFDTDLVNPRAIVVDSLSGNLYWTDWNREAPKIETSYIDGTNRRVLVKDDIGLPNGLTFDPFSLQLCWADAGTKNLECIFPDGTGRHVVQLGLNYPFSIVAYSNHFYYTDWRRDGVIVVNKANGQTTDEFLPDQRSHLYGITVAYPSCPHGRK
uniref:Nidogen 2 n=1 Tax=Callorhinchus milii TaxID=7868 RepID=A0A4W3IYC2_CALMI|eukprot:gi/632942351/ref/XP_007886366.1/ PREDICTED: nidogen-2 isoform X2 [Callorhinchus milii]